MISFFESKDQSVFAVQTKKSFSENEIKKLEWLFGNALSFQTLKSTVI